MAKKSGKVASKPEAQAAAPAAAPEAPAAEGKQPNVFLNRISEKMIRPVNNTKDGKDWTSVSFGIAGPDGNQTVGSILVRSNQVMDSTRKGANNERVPNPGFKNVLLGQPNQHYNVSLNQKDAEGNYITNRMSAGDIKTAVEEANKAYRAQKKAEKNGKAVDAPAVEEQQAEAEGLEA